MRENILSFKQFFLAKNQQPVKKKKFIATAVGHVPWGLGVAERFYNLYEYDDGTREYEKFDGGQYHDMPENTDYSTKAQVKAWLYGGNVPQTILNVEPLISEVNKEIQQYSAKVMMYDQDDEPMLKEMEEEIKKALDKKFKKNIF
ncbi:hypothetical protein [Bartonella sp. 1-1C]|uniref:hypothetical protein n=2 Tax=Bartonella sp. 1-1C TaxID=515256 RepID=UPI0001F4C977|nr:hypothetical protein [Bartonella sp. 1-1C]ATO57164.1 hypothetical protein B11Cv2_003820 [Bartonella sp. 1-1C]CBI80266.1 conserved hypothetical protein [Bartonella sp. 1-1C]